MSVRIYQISRETGVENKKILALLRERGFEVKSASSSIDNISAEALIDELQKQSVTLMHFTYFQRFQINKAVLICKGRGV